MILYLEDWNKYPTAVVHINTKNKSWLKMAEVYKAMGVKNHYFHLALFQPELADVDPHSPNLTLAQMVMIRRECEFNFWYYAREVARIPMDGSSEPGPVKANRGNLALWWHYFAHINIALIQIRQTGKSINSDVLATWLVNIGGKNFHMSLLTKASDTQTKNIARLKTLRGYIPSYISVQTNKDSTNTISLTNVTLGNTYTTAVAQSSAKDADKVGRGLTSPTVQIDELAYIKHLQVSLGAILASTGAAQDNADAVGAPWGNFFTTTAGDLDTEEGKYAYSLISGGMYLNEIIYDCKDAKEAQTLVRKNSKGLMPLVNATLSHLQLGYTDEWLYKKMAQANQSGLQADRDYRNIWTSGGEGSPLKPEHLKIIRDNRLEHAFYNDVTADSYTLRWYIPKEEIKSRLEKNLTVMGMDSSEAIGADSITLTIRDKDTAEVLMCTSIYDTNIIRFGHFLVRFMVAFPKVILVPEARSTGISIINQLLISLPAMGIDPFKRIYNTVVDSDDFNKEEFRWLHMPMYARDMSVYDRYRSRFGFKTSGSGVHARDKLYLDTLTLSVLYSAGNIKDAELSDQLTSLVTKKGRIDHPSGGHDDLVIAWLLGFWFLRFSTNIHYYGFENILSRLTEYGVEKPDISKLSPYELRSIQLQDRYREEIGVLLDRLHHIKDPYVQNKLEHRIRFLAGLLTHTYDETNSMDALIQAAKTKRQERRMGLNQPGTLNY